MTKAATDGVRRTRLVYERLCSLRDEQIAERARKAEAGIPDSAAGGDDPVVMRLRHTRDHKGKQTIDLSKADLDCVHCGGTGRKSDQIIEDKETGKKMTIPVVCRCVKAGGGVQKDMLDKLGDRAATTQKWTDRRKERRRLKRKSKPRKRRRTSCRSNHPSPR